MTASGQNRAFDGAKLATAQNPCSADGLHPARTLYGCCDFRGSVHGDAMFLKFSLLPTLVLAASSTLARAAENPDQVNAVVTAVKASNPDFKAL
jgi:hypothetical protein